MAKKNVSKSRASKRNSIPIGSRGKVRIGLHDLPVIFVEDRGYIGAKGQHLFRVRRDDPDVDPNITFEIYAESFVPAKG